MTKEEKVQDWKIGRKVYEDKIIETYSELIKSIESFNEIWDEDDIDEKDREIRTIYFNLNIANEWLIEILSENFGITKEELEEKIQANYND